jgi:hypothetical protein
MTIQLHGFNWETYTGHVMPAFMNWLVENNAAAVQQLYEKTRCAHEEASMPPAMQPIQTWARARSFIKQLPRGPHASREYRKLCSAEQFTTLSDRYIYRHPPRLYQDYDALRAVWGAIVEEYCLSWLPLNTENKQNEKPDAAINLPTKDGELAEFRQTANLKELAQKAQQADEYLEEEEDECEMSPLDKASRNIGPAGIHLGCHPATLYMRGWLANISIRAMALFELLACGRRAMPFGYQACEPFESYIGYLTPGEVWQLALSLHNVHPPVKSEVEERYRLFHQQSATQPETFRMPDEIPPAHADTFLKAVRAAASYGQGLICDVQ